MSGTGTAPTCRPRLLYVTRVFPPYERCIVESWVRALRRQFRVRWITWSPGLSIDRCVGEDEEDTDFVLVHLQMRTFPRDLGLPTSGPKTIYLEVDAFLNFCDLQFGSFETRNAVERIFERHGFDSLVVRDSYSFDRLSNAGYPVYWSPHGVDVDVFRPGTERRRYDAGFIGATYPLMYGERRRIVEVLRKHVRRAAVRDEKRRMAGAGYVTLLNDIKLLVSWPISPAGSPIKATERKAYEAASCGACLLRPRTPEFERLGFVPGEHYVEYQDPEILPMLVSALLSTPEEIARVVRSARAHVVAHHTWLQRAGALHDWLRPGARRTGAVAGGLRG